MKRFTTVAITCLAVALSGAALAVASGGSGRDHPEDSTTGTTETTTNPSSTVRSRKYEGRVTAVDATAKIFTLKVRKHHRRSTRTVTITVNDATRFKRLADGIDSIEAGQRIKAKVRKSGDDLVASRVERKRGGSSNSNNSDDDDGTADQGGANNDDGPNHDAGDDHGGNSGHGGGDHDD